MGPPGANNYSSFCHDTNIIRLFLGWWEEIGYHRVFLDGSDIPHTGPEWVDWCAELYVYGWSCSFLERRLSLFEKKGFFLAFGFFVTVK